MEIREATRGEGPTVRGVLNAAMLEIEDTVERSLSLVAVDDDRIIGALLLAEDEIAAVAVRPGRRGQGVGSKLVEAAAARRETVTARFDPSVRPFYRSLGFEILPESGTGRCRGRRG